MIASTTFNVSRTRLSGRPLQLARLAWVLVALLAIVLLAYGLPSYYAEKAQVCMLTTQKCDQLNLTQPNAAQILERAGLSVSTYARLVLAFKLAITAAWSAMGVLIFLRRSDDWLALIVSTLLLLYTTGGLRDFTAQTYPALAPLTELGFSLQNMLLMLFVALFPGGRFAPRFLTPYWIFAALISLVPESLFSSSPERLVFYAVIAWGSFLVLAPVTLIYRYKKVLSPLERQQTKWVIAGITGMAAMILLIFFFINAGGLARVLIDDFYFDLASILLPLSLGFSVLRYRLWDIDVLIRRTLIYATLSLALAALYLGGVVLVQSIFHSLTGENSPVAVVASTLLIAALFNPLRLRIQDGIDRRFYRNKYDAEKALEAFAAQARSEANLEELVSHLVTAVSETMQPERVTVWLMRTGADRHSSRAA